jgi:four helix bundle protein
MGNYKQLSVWQKSIELVVSVYTATAKLPKDEVFGLRLQMRRAAVSIPCNIAEGQGRSSAKDYRRFILQARGSLLELETQIVICERLQCMETKRCNELRTETAEIGRMLNGLLRYLTPDA